MNEIDGASRTLNFHVGISCIPLLGSRRTSYTPMVLKTSGCTIRDSEVLIRGSCDPTHGYQCRLAASASVVPSCKHRLIYTLLQLQGVRGEHANGVTEALLNPKAAYTLPFAVTATDTPSAPHCQQGHTHLGHVAGC